MVPGKSRHGPFFNLFSQLAGQLAPCYSYSAPPDHLAGCDLTTFKVEVESDYIGTGDSHRPTSSQSRGLLYLYLVMVIVRVNYRYRYTRGSGRVEIFGAGWVYGYGYSKIIGYGYADRV